jgi:hypothetical protein
MTRIDDDPIASGRAALSRLEKDQTFEDWVLVGQALKIGRTNAKKASGSFEANMASWQTPSLWRAKRVWTALARETACPARIVG